MDPVTENVKVPCHRRARKVIIITPHGVDECVSIENVQAYFQKVALCNVEVAGSEIVQLEQNANKNRLRIAEEVDFDGGIRHDNRHTEIDWDVEKYYPSTEHVGYRTKRLRNEAFVCPDISNLAVEIFPRKTEDLDWETVNDVDTSFKTENADGTFESSKADATQKSLILLGKRQDFADEALNTDSPTSLLQIAQDNTHSNVCESTTDNSTCSIENVHIDLLKPSFTEADSKVVCSESLDDYVSTEKSEDTSKDYTAESWKEKVEDQLRNPTAVSESELHSVAEMQGAATRKDVLDSRLEDKSASFELQHDSSDWKLTTDSHKAKDLKDSGFESAKTESDALDSRRETTLQGSSEEGSNDRPSGLDGQTVTDWGDISRYLAGYSSLEQDDLLSADHGILSGKGVKDASSIPKFENVAKGRSASSEFIEEASFNPDYGIISGKTSLMDIDYKVITGLDVPLMFPEGAAFDVDDYGISTAEGFPDREASMFQDQKTSDKEFPPKISAIGKNSDILVRSQEGGSLFSGGQNAQGTGLTPTGLVEGASEPSSDHVLGKSAGKTSIDMDKQSQTECGDLAMKPVEGIAASLEELDIVDRKPLTDSFEEGASFLQDVLKATDHDAVLKCSDKDALLSVDDFSSEVAGVDVELGHLPLRDKKEAEGGVFTSKFPDEIPGGQGKVVSGDIPEAASELDSSAERLKVTEFREKDIIGESSAAFDDGVESRDHKGTGVESCKNKENLVSAEEKKETGDGEAQVDITKTEFGIPVDSKVAELEEIPTRLVEDSKMSMDDDTFTDRGIISSKTVNLPHFVEGTQESAVDTSSRDMEEVLFGFVDQRKADSDDFKADAFKIETDRAVFSLGKVQEGQEETSLDAGDWVRGAKGAMAEELREGQFPTEHGDTWRYSVAEDEHLPASLGAVSDATVAIPSAEPKKPNIAGRYIFRAAERGDISAKSIDEAFTTCDKEHGSVSEDLLEGRLSTKDHLATEQGDIPGKVVSKASVFVDAGHGIISSKTTDVPVSLSQEKGTSGKNIPSKFTEGAYLHFDKPNKPEHGNIPAEDQKTKDYGSTLDVLKRKDSSFDEGDRIIEDAKPYESSHSAWSDRGFACEDTSEGGPEFRDDQKSTESGGIVFKSEEDAATELDYHTLGDREIISGKLIKGLSFVPQDQATGEATVPPKFMEGAYFGLDIKGDHSEFGLEGNTEEGDLEVLDGSSHSTVKKHKIPKKEKKKGKGRFGEHVEQFGEDVLPGGPVIDASLSEHLGLEPEKRLSSSDSKQSQDASSVWLSGQELEEQKHLQELKEQKRMFEVEEQKRLKELEEKKQQKLEEEKRLQELEEEKRLQEQEEEKRLQEIQVQKRLQEQRRLEQRLEQRLECCRPIIQRLDLFERRLANIQKIPSQPEKLEERRLQLEELLQELNAVEGSLESLKDEWSDMPVSDDEVDPIESASAKLQQLQQETKKSSYLIQELISDRRQKQDQISEVLKQIEGIQLWFHEASTKAYGQPIQTSSSRFITEQLLEATTLSEHVERKLKDLSDVKDQLHNLSKCEELKAEYHLEEKLSVLENDMSTLKSNLDKKLKTLKVDAERNEKRQKEVQNLDASLADIQKKAQQMLKSAELPSKEDLEMWKQLPKPSRDLQKMLQVGIQEQRELVKTVADQHDMLKMQALESSPAAREKFVAYTPLPLSVVMREPGSSKVLEALVQKKLAELQKYWQTIKQDSNTDLEEYLSGQQNLAGAMSLAIQWLDCLECEVSQPSTAADIQNLQKQTKAIRLIQQELLDQQKTSTEIAQTLEDLLPSSQAQQVAILTQSLEDLDRRLDVVEREAKHREQQAAECKAWQTSVQDRLADIHKLSLDCQQQYLSLSDGKIPCDTRLVATKQLNDSCNEGLRKLDTLRTEVWLRTIQDPAVSVPSELFSLRHQLKDLHGKIAEKKADLSRAVNSNIQYETLLEQYAEFLETAHEKVKTVLPSVSDVAQLQDQLSTHKGFFQDLVNHQTLLESMGHKVEPREIDRYHDSHARLNALTLTVLDKANIQEMRMRRAVDQWSELGQHFSDKITWLGNIEQRLPQQAAEDGSIEALEKRIQDLRLIQEDIDAEKGSVSQIVDSGRQLLKLISCPALSRKLDDFANKCKKLDSKVTEELKSLEALAKLLKQFDSEADLLEQWMKPAANQTEFIHQAVAGDNQSHEDIAKVENVFRELKREFEDHLSHKTSAVAVGNKLLQSRPADAGVRNKLKQILADWSWLESSIADIETRIQNAVKALLPSRQALGELLQYLNSIQNSIAQDADIHPRSRLDVKHLLKKYKSLKGDLANLQLSVDYVNKVADESSRSGSHSDQTLSAEQLGEMNRQYQAICSDVNSKVVKLEMASDAWKEFEDAVHDQKEWLADESAKISAEEKNLGGTSVQNVQKTCLDMRDALRIKRDKDFESTVVIGSNLLKSPNWSANPEEINKILDELKSLYDLVVDKLKNLQTLTEKRKHLLDNYNLAYEDVTSAIDGSQSSLNKLQLTSGCDAASLKEQVSHLQALQKKFDGSDEAVRKLNAASEAISSTNDPSSNRIFKDNEKRAADRWQSLKREIKERLSTLEFLSLNWTRYDEQYSDAINWLNKTEMDIGKILQEDCPENKEKNLKNLKVKQNELTDFRNRILALEAFTKELIPALDSARVVHIVSNQTSLNHRAGNLEQLVERHLENFGSVEGDQLKFNKDCHEVEKFLEEAKAVLPRIALPYDPSDRKVVQDRLNLVRDLMSGFAQMNPRFQELNHSGYRLPLSKTDSERLRWINGSWHELLLESKEMEKKLQHQCLLLQTFSDKCMEWSKCLAEVEKDLSVDISGNYNSMLAQQQKLETFQQEVFPRQQILYSIISDGHEMMKNSHVVGEDFGSKLKLLEEQWQKVVKQANQRKALIDSILSLWQTYRELFDQQSLKLRGLKDFVSEHPVSANTFSSLQQLLDEYTDVSNQLNSTEPSIDKLHSYCSLLSSNVDSATIKRLELEVDLLDEERRKLASTAESRVKLLNNVLLLWDATQSKMEGFVAWLKEIKKHLIPDVPTKYNALIKELEKLKNLQADKSDQCAELTKDLEELTHSISSEDSLILCQRLRLLTKQQSEVSGQIVARREAVQDLLDHWTDFDRNVEDLMAAFFSIEQKMNRLDDVLSIEDSITEIQNFLQPEMEILEKRKVKLVRDGKELRWNSQDLRATDIDHKIATMAEKCNQLKEVLNEKLNKLTVAVGTLVQLEKNIGALRRWLIDMEHTLTTPVVYETSSNTEIQLQLKKQQALQKDIDSHNVSIMSVLSLCDNLSTDRIACPSLVESQSLQLARNTLESRWRKIVSLSVERKHLIEETGQLWQQFSSAHQSFSVWLRSVERQLLNSKSTDLTFKALKNELKNIQKLQGDIQMNHSDLDSLNRLYCRLAHEGRTDLKKTLKHKIDDANRRWDSVLARAEATVKRLSHILSVKEDFDAHQKALLIWLSSFHDALTDLERLNGPPNSRTINFVKKELASSSNRTEYIDRAALFLLEKCEMSDAVQIQHDIDDFHQLHATVLRQLSNLEDRQHVAGSPDADIKDEQSRNQIHRLQQQLEKSKKKEFSSEFQAAVGRLEENVEGLDDGGDLWSAGDQPGRRSWHGDQSFLMDLSELEKWLLEANAILDSEKKLPQDMAQYDRCLKKHKELTEQVKSRKPAVFRIRSALSPVAQQTHFAEGLYGRISTAAADWDRLRERASDWFSRLQETFSRTKEFHLNVEELAQWMEDVEADVAALDLEDPVSMATPLSVVEARRDKLMLIGGDLENIGVNLEFLRNIADYFLSNTASDSAIGDCEKLDRLADELEALRAAYNNHKTILDAASGKASDHIVPGSRGYAAKGSWFPVGSGKRRISRLARLSATKQRHPHRLPDGDAGRGSYLGLLRRACRTAIPIQLTMLVLIGIASLVPMCENECILNALNPVLSYADGSPPL